MFSFFLSLWKMILYFKSCFDELCVRIITAISCGNFWCWMHPFSMITSSAISQSRDYFPAGFKKENLKKKKQIAWCFYFERSNSWLFGLIGAQLYPIITREFRLQRIHLYCNWIYIYMPVAPDMYLNFFRSWSPTRIISFRSDY